MHTVICTPLYGHIIQQPTTIPTLYMYIHVGSSGTPVDTKFTVAPFPGLRTHVICVGENRRPGAHCLRMRQILHKIGVNHVISVQFRVFITSNTVWLCRDVTRNSKARRPKGACKARDKKFAN